jgi:hypothetical protein
MIKISAAFFVIVLTGVYGLTAPVDFIEKTIDGVSESENGTLARKEIIESATEKITTDMLRELLGEAKFNKNRALLNSKIFKNSGRFIPVIKTGDLIKAEKGYKLSVFLQVNTKTLEAMLLENGLLYEFDSLPSILPMISIHDLVREKKVIWWTGVKDDVLKNFALQTERLGQKAFWSQGFFVERPLSGNMGLFLASEGLAEKGSSFIQAVAQKTHSQVVITGDILIRNAEISDHFIIEIKLTAVQVANDRVLAEAIRTINTERGSIDSVLNRKIITQMDPVFRELASQLLETWKRGTFGATIARLQVRGALPITKYEAFKEAVLQKSKQVRQISERSISSEESVFEMTLSGPLDQVAGQLKTLSIPGTVFNLSEIKENLIVLQKINGP